MKTSVC